MHPCYSKDVSKVTSKLQVTIPKVIAERYSIVPGDELEWIATPDAVRVIPAKALARPQTAATKLRLFDSATKRQQSRQSRAQHRESPTDRGWTREELYDRGSSR
jgi:AbrB family looped-hinge helix DNA binding protein